MASTLNTSAAVSYNQTSSKTYGWKMRNGKQVNSAETAKLVFDLQAIIFNCPKSGTCIDQDGKLGPVTLSLMLSLNKLAGQIQPVITQMLANFDLVSVHGVVASDVPGSGTGTEPCGSKAAIKRVQAALGVTADGVWGAKSASALAASGRSFVSLGGCTGNPPVYSGGGGGGGGSGDVSYPITVPTDTGTGKKVLIGCAIALGLFGLYSAFKED